MTGPLDPRAERPATDPQQPSGFARELAVATRGSSMGFIGQSAGAVLAFAFSVVVGRLFHARGAGTFFEAVAIFAIAGNIGDLGADDGLNWAVPRLRQDGRLADVRRLIPIACLPVLVVASLLGVVLLIAAAPIAHVFSNGHDTTHLATFLRILAPFVPVVALVQVFVAGTRGFDRVWPLVAIWSVLVPVVQVALLPVLVVAGFGLIAAAYSWGVPIALGAFALLWTLLVLVDQEHRDTGAGRAPTGRGPLARNFWAFSGPRALASICAMALVWLDVLLVGSIDSVKMAGIYAVANRYLVVATFALAAVGGTIGPQVSRLLSKGRRGDLQRLYQTSTSWVMAIAWPCAMGMAVFAPVLMRIYGPEFATGSGALTILALMMLYVSGTGTNVVVLVMSGRNWTSLWIGAVTLTINVVANVVLIPRMGIDGAAVAWAASLLVSNVLINVVLYRQLGLHPFGTGARLVALASLCCVGLVGTAMRFTVGTNWSALVATAVVGGGTYLAVLWRSRHRLELAGMLGRFER